MVTARYLPTGIQIATKPLPGPTNENIGNMSLGTNELQFLLSINRVLPSPTNREHRKYVFGYELQFLLSGVVSVFHNLSPKLL